MTSPDGPAEWTRKMAQVRTLPIRVQPVDGEALDSWLEATAHRAHTHLADLVGALAAGDEPGRIAPGLREAAHWIVQIPGRTVERIAAATGVPPAQLQAMTLARFDGTALRLSATGRTVDRRALWGRGTRSRFCPDCLADSGGRWQLWWRVGWAFACPRHHQLLADSCPACHQPQRQRFAPSHVIPHPGQCARPPTGQSGLAERRCNGDLTRADVLHLPEDHPALATQRLLLQAIDSGRARFGVYTDKPLPLAAALADARAVACRILSYATTAELTAVLPTDLLTSYRATSWQVTQPNTQGQHRPGYMAPAQAITSAVGLTAAFTILGAPTVQRAGAALRWLVDGCRRDGLTVSPTSTRAWGRGTSRTLAAVQLAALDPSLEASERLRYRTMSTYPRRPEPCDDAVARRARQVPTLLWPAWALRMCPAGISSPFFRLAASCGLLVIDTRLTLAETTLKLGTPSTGRGIGRVLQMMLGDPSWPQVSTALIRLADHLDTHDVPIDYERRGQLDYDALLPDEVWIRSCQRLGRPVRERNAAVARAVLFERLSGLPAEQAPGFVDTPDFRATVGSFPRFIDVELAACMSRTAQEYLHDQGIGDEPVTWQPSLTLLADLDLPGPDPSRIDAAALHRAVRQPDTPLEVASAQLDTTLDVVRHLLLDHPLPHQPGSRQTRARVRPMLSRADFLQLYNDERMALHEIASKFTMSRHALADLAREYGITLRSPGRPAAEIDAGWLYEQYVVKLRTLPDIAREVGMSTMAVNRRAHRYNIPVRPRGAGSRRGNLDNNGTPKQVVNRAGSTSST